MIYSMFRATRSGLNKLRVRALLFSPLLIFSLFGFSMLACAQQVTVTGRLELARKRSAATPDSSNGVVWLTRIGEEIDAPTSNTGLKQQLVQKNKSFNPHLIVVQVGSSVVFPNKDPFFHNVFSLFEGKRFDLGLYEAGGSRAVVFDREGISYIFCNIHPEMSAVVVSLKTPYYGISDARGTVAIPDVPLGRYELHVWHERAIPESLDAQVHTISVTDDAHSFGTLRIAEQPTATLPHKNKYGQDYETPSPGDPLYPHP
jgi:plastocyanin